jgi:hypothetical protein
MMLAMTDLQFPLRALCLCLALALLDVVSVLHRVVDALHCHAVVFVAAVDVAVV